MTHINDIVKPTDSILIVPAPAGYLVMKAPTSDDHEPEMFAALSSAGDLLLFLIDLYAEDMPEANASKEKLVDLAMDLFDVGRAQTGDRKTLPEVLNTEPEKLPAIEGQKIVIAKPVRKPLQIAKVDMAAKATHNGAGRRITLTATAKKNPAAVALGRQGGLKGGKARAEKLSPEERSAIAKKGAEKRWAAKNLLEPKVATVVKTMLEMQPITHKPTIEETRKKNIEKAKAQSVALGRGPLGFMCDECGETFEKCPQECPKCGSGTMEQLD